MERVRHILHIDGDAFFASCEQASDPRLKGKPVITGYERGIAVAVSYEAKKLGVRRGDPVFKIRREHPECILTPSHYELYERFSKRMLSIVRRYTPNVEEYSIDECFADLSSAYLSAGMSPRDIAWCIKQDIELELGMTFSLGVGPTKVLAKVASSKNKPAGFVYLTRTNHVAMLKDVPVADVWGIGRATSKRLVERGVYTAYDLVTKDVTWVERHFSKPVVMIWQELRGRQRIPLNTLRKETFDSISKTRTFRPPTQNPVFLLAQLSKNIEGACRKARTYGLSTDKAHVFIKTQEFKYRTAFLHVSEKTHTPSSFIKETQKVFYHMWRQGELYRATGVTLESLVPHEVQRSLFEKNTLDTKMVEVFRVVDTLSQQYGPYMVFLSSSKGVIDKRRKRDIDSTNPKSLLIPVLSSMSRRVYVPVHGFI